MSNYQKQLVQVHKVNTQAPIDPNHFQSEEDEA